jgi:8-amino-7-oxononanoate synthase
MPPIAFNDWLDRRRAEQLYRERGVLSSPQGIEIDSQGTRFLSFCSNDYLGLANHPQVIDAFRAAARQYGVGAGASHLITGHSQAHQALEEELADFIGAERALLFSTGYMANLGVVTALSDRHGLVFEDKLNHASLVDAARLTRARVRRFPHRDTAMLEAVLAAPAKSKMIVTDAVFSMDGDLAPVPELYSLAKQHDTLLYMDDAHGIGVLGDEGRGSLEHWDLPARLPVILMGTLGKAFGTFGAFVAGEAALIETLIQRARTYIYTTALPPAVAEATRASLRLIRADAWRRVRLQERVRQFRRGAAALGFQLPPGETPIQPLVFGETDSAVAASGQLRAGGILVPAIRPPTVAPGSARLRITFSAAHEPGHIERLLAALAPLAPRR